MYSTSRPALLLVALLLGLAVGAGRIRAATDLAVYDDALASGWSNWSWNTTVSFTSTTAVHSGSQSISARYTTGWAGLYLHADSAISTATYTSLRFWINGGSGGTSLRVVANGDGDTAVAVTAPAGVWTQVSIALTDLGSPSSIGDLYWQDTTGAAQPAFALDDIVFVASTGPPPPPPTPGTGPALHVNVQSARHTISDDIYGMNYADEALASALRLPVRRWGGNSTTRYNWQYDTHNTGSDWYFENIPDDSLNVSQLPNGSSADQFVEQDRRTGTRTLMTAPLIGWTPKRRPSGHPYDCGFSVSIYGAQQSVDPWDGNCGNGVRSNGTAITGNAATDTSQAIDPTFVSEWIAHLSGKYGKAAAGGVAYWNLDNEPMLWNSTHRDVHPQPVTYDELRDRTYAYAAAIKSADAGAKTLGPVLWGWCAYLYSASDGCGPGSDFSTHGSQYFVPWYLQQMHLYETQHAVRILDYLDLHYYPQATGVSLSSAGSSSTQALRLRTVRSLWDPTYIDESWISDTASGGVAVRLIPRMKEWIAANYPGTKTAMTEYNWGGLDHINGALAQADALGVFGREGLDLATLWAAPGINEPGAFAFRIYRNYDGSGHGFGDVGVDATSADQAQVSIYASQRTTDGALTIVAINKTSTALTSSLALTGFSPASPAAVYRYDATAPGAIVRQADLAVSASGYSATYPANSITLVVMVPAVGSQVTVSVTLAGSGAGRVSGTSVGIDCGVACVAGVTAGTPVALTAMAGTDASFKVWRGACAGSGTTCTVTPTSASTVTAVFSQTFSDDPLIPGSTTIRLAHLRELRSAVDRLRSRNGLSVVAWTDPSPVAAQTPIRAQHLAELRTALLGGLRGCRARRPQPSRRHSSPARRRSEPPTSQNSELRSAHWSSARPGPARTVTPGRSARPGLDEARDGSRRVADHQAAIEHHVLQRQWRRRLDVPDQDLRSLPPEIEHLVRESWSGEPADVRRAGCRPSRMTETRVGTGISRRWRADITPIATRSL